MQSKGWLSAMLYGEDQGRMGCRQVTWSGQDRYRAQVTQHPIDSYGNISHTYSRL